MDKDLLRYNNTLRDTTMAKTYLRPYDVRRSSVGLIP